jgi:hypothetical protein
MNRLMPGSGRDERELIATFGGARLVKTLDNKLELIGGSPEDRRAANEWCSLFLRESPLPAKLAYKVSAPWPH